MSEYLSSRKRSLNIGIRSYTENDLVLDVIGNTNISGIASIATLSAKNANIAGVATLTSISAGGTTGSNQYVLTSLGNSLEWQSLTSIPGVTGINVVEDFTSGLKYLAMQTGAGSTPSNTISSNQLVYNSTTTNLGIGTTNPTSKLTVQGDGLFTGVVTATTFYGALDATNASKLRVAYATTAGIATNLQGGSGGSIPYQYSSGITSFLANGSPGELLQSNGSTNAPSWLSSSGITIGYANTAGISSVALKLQTPRIISLSGDVVGSVSFDGSGDVSIASTIQPNSVGLGTDTTGDYVQSITGTANQITVSVTSGESSTPVLSIPTQFTAPQDVTVTRDLQVDRNLNVNGNITIGGTNAFINVQQLRVNDSDIVLGFRTDAFGNDVSNDTTANHGGIAVASTEGNPLVSIYNPGIGESTLPTYKKIMWFKSGTFAGLGTDAWLFNYAVGIGSTQFPAGTRLAAGNVQFTENDLAVVRNINASGIITATKFVGDLIGYVSTAGVATNLQGGSASQIPYQYATGITSFIPNGTTGYILQSNGTNTPSWVNPALGFNVSNADYATKSGISTNVIGGIGSLTQLQVTGISTFTNGPVFIGSGTSTGTTSQPLQVTGGAYVSGNLGIGTTNPTSKLTVVGNANFIGTSIGFGTSYPVEIRHYSENAIGGAYYVQTQPDPVQYFSISPPINNEILTIQQYQAPPAYTSPILKVFAGIGTTSRVEVYEDLYLSNDLITSGNITATSNMEVSSNLLKLTSGVGTVFFSNNTPGNRPLIIDPDYTQSYFRINSSAVGFGSTTNLSSNFSFDTLFEVNANGNIGIGTSLPTSKLEVVGELRIVSAGTTEGEKINIKHYRDISYRQSLGVGATNNKGALSFEGSSSFAGIGTTMSIPVSLLAITDDVSENVFSVSGYKYYSGSRDSALDVTSSGRLGIGITNPVTDFQINRQAYFSQNIGVNTVSAGATVDIRGDLLVTGASASSTEYIKLKPQTIGINTFAPTRGGISYEGDLNSTASSGGQLLTILNDNTSLFAVTKFAGLSSTRLAPAGQRNIDTVFQITSGGNVGIGTTNPTAKLDINGGTVTTATNSTPLNITQTWNNASQTFTAINASITDTASSSGYLLKIDRNNFPAFRVIRETNQQGGASLQIGYNQANFYNYVQLGPIGGNYSTGIIASSGGSAASILLQFSTNSISLPESQFLAFGADISFNNYSTLPAIGYDASGTLAQRNGTAAQTFRVYNTYTSGTNYELGKLEWSSSVFRVGTEKGSAGGTARELHLQTNGTTRVAISTTGLVGIGTTNPQAKLHVVGDTLVTGITTSYWKGSEGTLLSISNNLSTGSIFSVCDISGIPSIDVDASGIIALAPYGINLSKVGIGTTNPQQKLHVIGNALVSGNVGIGTTNPLYTFSVTGSNAVTTPGLTNVLADFTANTNSFSQINTRNASNGDNASSDIIATADTGTNSTNYIDLGINNSGFSSPISWTINGALDGYLYTSDTNLSIGAASNKYVSIFTGGTLAANERLRVTGTGSVGIGTTNPQAILDVSGDALISGLTIGKGTGSVSTNTALGYQALKTNTTGSNNTATGYQALFSNTTGFSNTANGYRALLSNTIGVTNTATGSQALLSNTTGYSNTAVGYQALYSNTTGTQNIATGRAALYSNTTGNSNTANGYRALLSNTTGTNNTANGSYSLYSNTTGIYNTANGVNALYSNTTGNNNTANGLQALYSNTTGSTNTANGYRALYTNTTGIFNTAIGSAALQSNTNGYSNTALGDQALFSNTTGNYNTANGCAALRNNTTGRYNTANGYRALRNNTTGINNTANGYNAGNTITTGTNNSFLGYNSQPSAVSVSNEITLGDTNVDTLRVPGLGFYGVRTNTTVATTSTTTIDSIVVATYRSARIQIQITQGTNYQVSDVLLIHDGTTASIIEYGTLATGSTLGTYSAIISGGNALLQVSMGSATSSAVKVLSYRTVV